MFGKIKQAVSRLISGTRSAATATAATVAATTKAAANATATATKAVVGAITRRTHSVAMAFSSESAMASVARFRLECRDCLDNLWALAGEIARGVGPWLAVGGFAVVAAGFVSEGLGLIVGPMLLAGWALASLSVAYSALFVVCSLIMGLQEFIGDLLVASKSYDFDFDVVNETIVVDAVAACPAVAIV